MPLSRMEPPRLHELLLRADVFVESFGAGRAERLGFGYEQLGHEAPGLVVCSVSGYGRTGPWRDRPGYDALVAAHLGLHHEVDGPEPGPHFLGHPALAYGTGFLLAIGALAALRARRLTGTGQLVDVSLLDRSRSPRRRCPGGGASAGCPSSPATRPERTPALVAHGSSTDSFECADGEYVMVHSGGPGGFKRSMEILGFGDRVRAVDGPGTGRGARRRRVRDRPHPCAAGVPHEAARRMDQALRRRGPRPPSRSSGPPRCSTTTRCSTPGGRRSSTTRCSGRCARRAR